MTPYTDYQQVCNPAIRGCKSYSEGQASPGGGGGEWCSTKYLSQGMLYLPTARPAIGLVVTCNDNVSLSFPVSFIASDPRAVYIKAYSTYNVIKVQNSTS